MAKKKVQNAADRAKLANGLAEVILGFNPLPGGPQISNVNTIFYNLRNYLISNMRQPISEAYVEYGIVKTIVDVPVDDAFRGGVEYKSKELNPEEIEELQFTVEQEGDLLAAAYEQKWDRLYGGGGIIIVTGQDPLTELDINGIEQGDPLRFKDVDMWELFWDRQNIEGDGEPIDSNQTEFYTYYGKKFHKSRVLITKGLRPPSFIRPRLRGWGLSQLEILVRSINQFLKATDLTFEVLDEFKIDIYKIKNLANTLLSANGTSVIQQRVQLANQQKNYQNAITMDSEDDFAQKELSFQGLAETMNQIRMQIASDLRMPLTKVFGISAAGFSSGEDDIENYNAMVESTVRAKVKPHLITMAKLRCQQLFGYVPDDLTINFKPLRILSSEQQENVKNAQFSRVFQAKSANLIDDKEFRDACNKEQLLPVQLETDEQTLSAVEDQQTEAADSEAKAPGKEGKKSATAPKEAKS